MLEVIGLLNEIEIMGGEIDGETQVDMILETLSESFDSFKLNYSMNKLGYSLTELKKVLQAAEALFNKGKNKTAEANLDVNKRVLFQISRSLQRLLVLRKPQSLHPSPKLKVERGTNRKMSAITNTKWAIGEEIARSISS